MNYKVMKRPMFRLGGSARKDFNTGGLGEIEELINKRLYIEVAKKKYQAVVEVTPLKDKQARFL